MNRDKNPALANLSREPFGFVFRDSTSCESPQDSTDTRTHGAGAESANHRADRNEGLGRRNREESATRQKTQSCANDSADEDARRRPFRRFGVVFEGEVLRASFVGHERRNIVARKTGQLELTHDFRSLRLAGGDAISRFFRHIDGPSNKLPVVHFLRLFAGRDFQTEENAFDDPLRKPVEC